MCRFHNENGRFRHIVKNQPVAGQSLGGHPEWSKMGNN
jgi:hypothetical protein